MPVEIRELVLWIEEQVPLEYQESYDNSGLQVGNPDAEINSILFTLDVTEEVIEEAVNGKYDLIFSHHPLIFSPLKRLCYQTKTERCVAAALKNNISVYSAHTNLDAMSWGVSHIMAEKAGLNNIRVLLPVKEKLFKLVTFVPLEHVKPVQEALFKAGAGHTGNYDSCSFSSRGEGTFRPGKGTKPFTGKVNELHTEQENRIEVIIPAHIVSQAVRALQEVHPYEEVAYDIIPLENDYYGAGTGAIGILPSPLTGEAFLAQIKKIFGTPVIRFSGDPARIIRTVAVCGGSGAGMIGDAARAGAEAFITGDVKYHAFIEAPDNILVADIGHYESEKFSLQLLYDLIIKKFPKFALRFSGIKTNPINYF